MNEPADIPVIPHWFVVFSGTGKRNHLVDWLSPPGFYHVSAFAYDAAGQRWLVYDVTRKGTVIAALTRTSFDVWLLAQRREGARVLKVTVRNQPRVWWRFGVACVGAVRHLTGVRSWALRPIGLWRDLKRQGAEEAFAHD